jgi:putative ABC transport system ATP-binding protein
VHPSTLPYSNRGFELLITFDSVTFGCHGAVYLKILRFTSCRRYAWQRTLCRQMPLIKLKDVSKLYGFGDATTIALDEVGFEVEKGEFVAIMGPSGSGKSTLLNVVGLLDRPSHGVYQLNGRNVERLRQRQRAKYRRDYLGFVFQSFNLLPRLTVLDNVALPLAYKGMTQTRRLKQAGNVLERVGLSDREYFYPAQLSGGQLQRAAIARALVNNPQIIIADEPTGNLDSAASRLVMELLSDIHKTGHTILMVTHNPELTRYASRVVFMHDGGIIADQQSDPGEVPAMARKLYFFPKKTEEDDLAGVSALMQAIDNLSDDNKSAAKSKRTRANRKSRSKRGKRA